MINKSWDTGYIIAARLLWSYLRDAHDLKPTSKHCLGEQRTMSKHRKQACLCCYEERIEADVALLFLNRNCKLYKTWLGWQHTLYPSYEATLYLQQFQPPVREAIPWFLNRISHWGRRTYNPYTRPTASFSSAKSPHVSHTLNTNNVSSPQSLRLHFLLRPRRLTNYMHDYVLNNDAGKTNRENRGDVRLLRRRAPLRDRTKPGPEPTWWGCALLCGTRYYEG